MSPEEKQAPVKQAIKYEVRVHDIMNCGIVSLKILYKEKAYENISYRRSRIHWKSYLC